MKTVRVSYSVCVIANAFNIIPNGNVTDERISNPVNNKLIKIISKDKKTMTQEQEKALAQLIEQYKNNGWEIDTTSKELAGKYNIEFREYEELGTYDPNEHRRFIGDNESRHYPKSWGGY